MFSIEGTQRNYLTIGERSLPQPRPGQGTFIRSGSTKPAATGAWCAFLGLKGVRDWGGHGVAPARSGRVVVTYACRVRGPVWHREDGQDTGLGEGHRWIWRSVMCGWPVRRSIASSARGTARGCRCCAVCDARTDLNLSARGEDAWVTCPAGYMTRD